MYPNFLRAELRKIIDRTFDGVERVRYPSLVKYFDRVEMDEHPRTVLEDFFNRNVKGKRYRLTMNIGGNTKMYSVRVSNRFGEHGPSSFLKMKKDEKYRCTKRALIGFYKLDDVLMKGIKTYPHDPNESITGRHKGWQFVTVQDTLIGDDGSSFRFIVELKLPVSVIDYPRVHSINPEGSDTFDMAAGEILDFKLKGGDSATITVMTSEEIKAEDEAIAEEKRRAEELKARRRAIEAENAERKRRKNQRKKRHTLDGAVYQRFLCYAYRNACR